MRYQHVCGEAAIDLDAEVTWCRAEVLFARLAGGTLAAADPGEDRRRGANLHIGIGAGFFDHACDLVPEREGERPESGDVELLVAAEAEVAVAKMQVGVADAAAADAHQHFGAARFGCLDDGLAERRRIGSHRLADHACHAVSLARATKPSTPI